MLAKRILITSYFLLAMLAFHSAANAQLYQWKPISTDDAVRMVKQFEGNPNAVVKVLLTPTPPAGVPYSPSEMGRVYDMECGENRYEIATSGQKIFFENEPYWAAPERHQGYGLNEKIDRSKMISEPQARAIAVRYLRKHYPSPELLYGEGNLPQVHLPYSPRGEYSYDFRQQPAKGVIGPGYCDISVEPIGGRVVRYRATTYPLLIATSPTLSPEDATASAVAIMGLRNASLLETREIRVVCPNVMGMQRLMYEVVVSARPPWITAEPVWFFYLYEPTTLEKILFTFRHIGTYDENELVLNIDAQDGSVMSWTPEFGLHRYSKRLPIIPQSKNAYSPMFVKRGNSLLLFYCLRVHCRPFVPAQYLCYGDPSAKLVKNSDGTFAIEGKAHKVLLDLKSRNYTLDGKTMRMPAKPVMVHSVPYVHASAMRGIVPFRFGYHWWSQTFWVGTPPDCRIFFASVAGTLLLLILLIRTIVRSIRRKRTRHQQPATHNQ